MNSVAKVSRSYTPLVFYTDSNVDYPAPILKGNKSVPLSSYTTILVYHPRESKIDVFVANEEKFHRRNYHPLAFYMDPTVSRPASLRINYIPLSSSSMPPSTAVSNSSSQSKVIFRCFGSQSSQSNSVSKNYIPLSFFGSFGSKSSQSKEQSSKSKVSKNYIPDEVAFSILSKSSIKSLTRFGCVCKSWSILFENTYFMTMYNKHFISHSHDDYRTIILTNHLDDLKNFPLCEKRPIFNLPSPLQQLCDDATCIHDTSILGSTSVNGIFCLGQTFLYCQKKSQYVLWNPLTEEFMVVPPSPTELIPNTYENGFFPEHDFHGFGYDQLRDDFKVIQLFGFNSTSFFEIYSLKSNSWRMIHMEKDLCRRDHSYTSSFNGLEVYLDGACHWLVSRYMINHKCALTLLSFDMSDEVFLTTPIGKEPYSPYTCDRRLTVLNRSIALISNYHDDIVFHVSILGELGVSESWIKLYTYGPLPSIQWPPIGFGKMGYMFVKKKDYKVAYVDLSTQIIKEVGITIGGHTSCFIVGLYKESLQRIK